MGWLTGKWGAFRKLWRLTSLTDALRFVWARARRQAQVDLRLKDPPCKIRLRPRDSDFEVLMHTFAEEGCRVEEWVSSPRLIVDAGANIGLTAILFARQFPGTTIVAIEPEPQNFRLLRANTAAFPQIRCVEAALWPRRATVALNSPANKSWGFRARETEADGEGDCGTVTLDEIFAQYGSIDLLKLDIEGAEWPLLETKPAAWLDRIPVVILELHGPDKEVRFAKSLEGHEVEVVRRHEKYLLLHPALVEPRP